MDKIKLKYLILGVIGLSVLMIAGALLFSKIGPSSSQKQLIDQVSQKPTAPPAASSPKTTSIRAVVKKVDENTLTVEEQDNQKNISIPLDKNVSFEAWVYKDGKNKPPTHQKATASDLKIGQKVDIFKTEFANTQSVYGVTILNE